MNEKEKIDHKRRLAAQRQKRFYTKKLERANKKQKDWYQSKYSKPYKPPPKNPLRNRILPWRAYRTTSIALLSWRHADKVFDLHQQYPDYRTQRMLKLLIEKHSLTLNWTSVRAMLKQIINYDWNPRTDNDWLTFVSDYDSVPNYYKQLRTTLDSNRLKNLPQRCTDRLLQQQRNQLYHPKT